MKRKLLRMWKVVIIMSEINHIEVKHHVWILLFTKNKNSSVILNAY
jgi:hypothetical protein